MEKTLVSVLTTAYNQEDFIAESIESVLASTYKNFELIIVDDQSSDNTPEIVNTYVKKDSRVKLYVNESNLGDYHNRNKAASYANGKYIKYLDSDDIIYHYGLDAMVSCMEAFPEAAFGLSAKATNNIRLPECISPREVYLEHFIKKNNDHFNRAPGSAIINREIFNKEGGFSGKRHVGDTELWLKLARKYPLVKMPRDLVWDREHPKQEMKIEMKKAKQYNKIRNEIILEALTTEDCPLNEKEKKTYLRQARVYPLKHKLIGLIEKTFRLYQ